MSSLVATVTHLPWETQREGRRVDRVATDDTAAHVMGCVVEMILRVLQEYPLYAEHGEKDSTNCILWSRLQRRRGSLILLIIC